MLINNSKRWAVTSFRAYAYAILGVAVAFSIRWQLHPILQTFFPVLFFFINTVFIAYKFGLGPSVLTIILSIPIGYYFFMPPHESFDMNDPIDIFTIVIYCSFFYFTTIIIEKLQRERYRAVLIARVCESRMQIMAKLSRSADRQHSRDKRGNPS